MGINDLPDKYSMPKAQGTTALRAYTYQANHMHYLVPMLQLICNIALWQAEGS